ncbi:MAG: MBL fold metallo-hydrolase [Pseudomonadota bacterium]
MATVTLMGVKGGPAIFPGSNMPTSLLLQMAGKNVLIDAGLGVTRGVCDMGLRLPEIDAIYVSHLHSDHFLELGPFFHTAWTAGLKHPISVIGPSGLKDYWTNFLRSMDDDVALRIEDEGRVPLKDLFEFAPIKAGAMDAPKGIAATAILNDHPPITESFALRFEGDGKSFVFSGDTAPMETMISFAKDADLLVHEAMMVSGVDRLVSKLPNHSDRLRTHILQSHSPADQVGKIAAAAKVKHLALTHLVPNSDPHITTEDWTIEIRKAYDGRLSIGSDGMKIVI